MQVRPMTQPGERERLLSTLEDMLRIDSGTSDMDRDVYVACYRLLEADGVELAAVPELVAAAQLVSDSVWVEHECTQHAVQRLRAALAALATPTLADEKGGESERIVECTN